MGARLFLADERTDKNKLIAAFRYFVNAPNNNKLCLEYRSTVYVKKVSLLNN